MITFNSFNLSRLLSPQVAPVCLGGEPRGSNAFLNFFDHDKRGAGFTSRNRSFPRLWSRFPFFERKHQSSKQWPKQPQPKLLLQISNYLASFRRKLQYPFGIIRKQRFSSRVWMYDREDSSADT
jgi:hypothetical protein